MFTRSSSLSHLSIAFQPSHCFSKSLIALFTYGRARGHGLPHAYEYLLLWYPFVCLKTNCPGPSSRSSTALHTSTDNIASNGLYRRSSTSTWFVSSLSAHAMVLMNVSRPPCTAATICQLDETPSQPQDSTLGFERFFRPAYTSAVEQSGEITQDQHSKTQSISTLWPHRAQQRPTCLLRICRSPAVAPQLPDTKQTLNFPISG